MSFSLDIDDREMQRYLEQFEEGRLEVVLLEASKRAAAVLRKEMKPLAPVKSSYYAGAQGMLLSRRGRETYYGNPGDLRESVRARRIRSNPALGYVIGPMGKKAFMRHWVVQGTKPHFVKFGWFKVVKHPGAKANPFVARAGDAALSQALTKAEKHILTVVNS